MPIHAGKIMSAMMSESRSVVSTPIVCRGRAFGRTQLVLLAKATIIERSLNPPRTSICLFISVASQFK